MKRYCHILGEHAPGEKAALCVAQTPSPRLLAVSERSIAASCCEKFQTDQQLRDEFAAAKGVRLWQFDEVFSGRQKTAALLSKVFLASVQELYDGQSCLVLNAVSNCRE